MNQTPDQHDPHSVISSLRGLQAQRCPATPGASAWRESRPRLMMRRIISGRGLKTLSLLSLLAVLNSCAVTELKPDQGIAVAQRLGLDHYVSCKVEGQEVSGALWYDKDYSEGYAAYVFYYPGTWVKGKYYRGGSVPFMTVSPNVKEALAQAQGYVAGYAYDGSMKLKPVPRTPQVPLTSPDYCEVVSQLDKQRDTLLGIPGRVLHGQGTGHSEWIRS